MTARRAVRDRGRDRAGSREERGVLFAHDDERRGVLRGGRSCEVGGLVGLRRDLDREGRPHHGRQGGPLPVRVLAESRALPQNPLVRRRPEQVELVLRGAQRGHTFGLHDGDAERDDVGIDPGGSSGRGVHEHPGDGAVGLCDHEPARHHPTHGMPE